MADYSPLPNQWAAEEGHYLLMRGFETDWIVDKIDEVVFTGFQGYFIVVCNERRIKSTDVRIFPSLEDARGFAERAKFNYVVAEPRRAVDVLTARYNRLVQKHRPADELLDCAKKLRQALEPGHDAIAHMDDLIVRLEEMAARLEERRIEAARLTDEAFQKFVS